MSKFIFILSNFGLPVVKPLLYDEIEPADSDEPIGSSSLNTPVFDNVTLQNKRENPDITLTIDSVLIDANLPKIIQKTVITGRKGRVKEFISLDDWQIVLRGVITSGVQDKYPQEDVSALINLSKIESEVPVISRYLQNCGVYDIVIEELKLPQRAGFYDSQLFEIQAVSDVPIELRLNEEAE